MTALPRNLLHLMCRMSGPMLALGLFLAVVLTARFATAHAPHFERGDYSEERPFKVEDSIENAKAIYARFDTGEDVDVYTFDVAKPVRLRVKALVTVRPGSERVLPWFAVVGPGLPKAKQKLPFRVPNGYGAIVVENVAPGEPRKTFYEPFGGETYYDSTTFDRRVSRPGKWYIYYWDPHKVGGDYVATLGFRERF
jgi:hypothetical protein